MKSGQFAGKFKISICFSFLNQGLLTSEIDTAGGLCLLAANSYTIALGIGDNQLGQACLSLVLSPCLLLCHIEGILLNGYDIYIYFMLLELS